jgi:hypothetical protein
METVLLLDPFCSAVVPHINSISRIAKLRLFYDAVTLKPSQVL